MWSLKVAPNSEFSRKALVRRDCEMRVIGIDVDIGPRLAGKKNRRAEAARFKTDFFFFLTLVACPCAIYCSLCVSLKLLTLNEAHAFVKRAERSLSGRAYQMDRRNAQGENPS